MALILKEKKVLMSLVDFGIDLDDEVIEMDGLVIFLLPGSKEDFKVVMDGILTISAS